jgi:hypothetical protein
MAKELDILFPAGIKNQTDLGAFQHNAKRAEFRRAVVERAVLYATWVQTKGGRKMRLSLAGNPEQHSKAMRGVMRSVVVEALWLYQCAPDGVNPIDWALARLAEQLETSEVIVAEYRDDDGEQKQRLGLVSKEGLRQGADHIRAALKFAEGAQKRADREAYEARQARRDATVAGRAQALKEAVGLA